MTGRRGNPLVLRKILPNPDLVIASTGADIGFYIVSLVGQVIYKGSVNRLIDAIQPLKATDILIEEPSLEEIFMHYYQ